MKKSVFSILFIGMVHSFIVAQMKDMAEIRADGIQIPVVNHNVVNNPVRGMMVYDSSTESYWYYDGGQWQRVGSKSTQIIDDDLDTGIGVEQFADSDEITFDVKGRTAFEIREIPGTTEILQFRVPDENFRNLLFGRLSGELIDTSGGSGFANTVFGIDAGVLLSTGSFNLFAGASAGEQNSTGGGNTFLGANAGLENQTACCNTAIGSGAGTNNQTSIGNVYIGFNTGNQNVDGFNTFVGESVAFQHQNGGDNTYVGARAASQTINGSNNVYLGNGTGEHNEGGNGNVFIGFAAGAGYGLSPEPSVSDVLAIANDPTTSPLIYGEFQNRFVKINDVLQLPPLAGAPLTCDTANDEGYIYLDDTTTPQKIKVCVRIGTGGTPSDWDWEDMN